MEYLRTVAWFQNSPVEKADRRCTFQKCSNPIVTETKRRAKTVNGILHFPFILSYGIVSVCDSTGARRKSVAVNGTFPGTFRNSLIISGTKVSRGKMYPAFSAQFPAWNLLSVSETLCRMSATKGGGGCGRVSLTPRSSPIAEQSGTEIEGASGQPLPKVAPKTLNLVSHA